VRRPVGVPAFEAFFSGVPASRKPGMAFVVVQHLAPDHTSLLSDILGRFTFLEVFEATDGMAVQPNCVYVIPPGRDVAILNGSLQLFEPTGPHGRRMAVDFFFRSLA
jgi:two-component system CheB/CheR fusion protein